MIAPTSAHRSPRLRHVAAAAATAALVLVAAPAAGAQAPATSQYSSGSAAGTGTTTAPQLRRVDYTAFGSGDRNVRRDVVRALDEAGLRFRRLDSDDARVRRYLTGPVGREVSRGGPFALGRATGTELRTTSPLAGRVFRAIFDTDLPYEPVVAAVLSRGDQETADQGRFVRGLATGFGSTGVATVYVERSDDRDKHLDEFRDIPGVSTVENIDEPAGRRRLVELLTTGATSTGASADDPGLQATTASALAGGGDDGGAPTGLLAALGLLGATAAFVVGGAFRRRPRSR